MRVATGISIPVIRGRAVHLHPPVFQDTRGAFVSAALTETCTVMGALLLKAPSITWNSTFYRVETSLRISILLYYTQLANR